MCVFYVFGAYLPPETPTIIGLREQKCAFSSMGPVVAKSNGNRRRKLTPGAFELTKLVVREADVRQMRAREPFRAKCAPDASRNGNRNAIRR